MKIWHYTLHPIADDANFFGGIYYTIYHMPDRTISFTATVETDYRFMRAAQLPKRKPGQSVLDQILDLPMEAAGRPALIVGSGKRKQEKRIADPVLFRKFAVIDSPEALLGFIRRFGRLTDEKEGDDIYRLAEEIRDMRRAIAFADKRKRHPPAAVFDLKADVVFNSRTRRIEQRVFPQTLLQALWLQFIYAPVSAATLNECKYCGVQFWAGVGTKRRADAKFCLHEHQVLFNSEKRSHPELENRK
jgi:hypothetical protein